MCDASNTWGRRKFVEEKKKRKRKKTKSENFWLCFLRRSFQNERTNEESKQAKAIESSEGEMIELQHSQCIIIIIIIIIYFLFSRCLLREKRDKALQLERAL